ncbi:retrotransposon hot spot protein (RHS), putative, partial [Trypanosoma cruzi]
MRLNDFLRNYIGFRTAVDEIYNVTMEEFVWRPAAYVYDHQPLEEVLTSKDSRLLIDENKLLDGGVIPLEHWGDFERKDTVTP